MALSTQDLKDIIINDAARVGNDPALMLALGEQESGFDPNALSPTRVRGLFQVTNATGKAYGQTPQTRTDPHVSSEAGQRYFKDLLYKANGDVPTALRWYNGGSDPQFAQKVLARVPTHAAALTREPSAADVLRDVYGDPQGATPGATPGQAPTAATPAAEPSAADVLRDVYGDPKGTTPGATPGPAPTPPASLGQPGVTPGMQPGRWRVTIAPGGTAQPDSVEVPGTWQDARDVVERLKAQYGAETRFGIGPVPMEHVAPPAAIPDAQGAVLGGPAPFNPAGPADTEAPLEESINPVDLASTGTAAYIGSKVASTAPRVLRPLITGLGAEAGYKLHQLSGEVAPQLTGATPGSVTNFGVPDLLNVALPYGMEAAELARRTALTYSRAGRALSAADTETAARQATYEQQVRDHEAQTLGALGEAQRTQQAAQREAQTTYTRQLDDYGNAVTAHRTAADRAGAVVRDAQPTTPSWLLYQKVRDAAPEALVDFAPVAATAKEVASAQGAEYLPARMQERLTRLQQGEATGTVATADEELKFWGPLTSSKNGTIRSTAKRVFGAIQDTLDQGASELPETAHAVPMLQDARAAFRKEKALEDVTRMVQSAGRTGDDGVFRYRPGHVVTQIDNRAATDSHFRGSFAPGELEGMRADFLDTTGIPKVPTTRPTLQQVPEVSDTPLQGVPNRPALPTPAEPELPPTLTSLGKHYFAELTGGASLGYLGGGTLPLKVAAAAGVVDTADALMSKLLMTPRGRAWLQRQMAADGSISREALLSALGGGRVATSP